jgi:ankyrin repeat protein
MPAQSKPSAPFMPQPLIPAMSLAIRSGKTALMFAVCAGHVEVSELLLQHGAEVNFSDKGEGSQ